MYGCPGASGGSYSRTSAVLLCKLVGKNDAAIFHAAAHTFTQYLRIALHVRELCQADSWQGELPPLHSHGRAGDTGTDELLTRRAQAGDVARAIGV